MIQYKNATRKVLAAAVLLGISTASIAQWQWRDKSGRMVFSDQAPPASVPAKNIIKQPGGTSPATVLEVGSTSNTATRPSSPVRTVTAARNAPAAAASASAPAPAAQKTPEELQKEAEAAAQQKAADEATAKQKADNCQRARNSLAVVKAKGRVTSRVDENGKPVIMDSAARSAEEQRLNKTIQDNC